MGLYQFIARLNFIRESWGPPPLDVERVRPAQDANEVAAKQVKAFLSRLPEEGIAPLFVFDAGYDPVKVQQGLEGDSVSDPRPFEGGASLLCRSEPRWSTCPHWATASPRA